AGPPRALHSAAHARRVRPPDGTSRHPGCSAPAENCDVDHVRPFSHSDPPRGGPTSEANLMCLCRRHHRLKTFHDWRYRLSRDGTLSVSTSSGLTLTTRPDGPLARWREPAGESVPRPAHPRPPRRAAVRQHQQWPHPDHTARRPLGALARTRRRVRPTLGVDTPAGEHALVPTRAPGRRRTPADARRRSVDAGKSPRAPRAPRATGPGRPRPRSAALLSR